MTDRHQAERGRGRLLRGARQIAGHIFRDERRHRAVYTIAPELPLFMLGGMLAGFEKSIDEALAARGAAANQQWQERWRTRDVKAPPGYRAKGPHHKRGGASL